MMSNNSDYVNNLLNRLAYVDLQEDYEPGANLIETLRNCEQNDLAKELEKAGYGDYVIKDYANQNNSTGFAAIAIEDPKSGDVGISYRGTENLPAITDSFSKMINGNTQEGINEQIDMIDNISTAVTGDSAQAQEALAFFEKNQSANGDNYLYGHSKGGELALEVYVENYDNIESVHIINPQPINWASLTHEQLSALQNGKIDATVINGDLVWLTGGVPYKVRIIKNNGSQGNGLFAPHDLKSADYDDNGNAKPEHFPFFDYPIQGILGIGATCLITLTQAGYKIIKPGIDWIKNTYQFFTEKTSEYAHRLWDATNNLWQATTAFGIKVVENVTDFFSDLTDAASNWLEELFGGKDKNSANKTQSSSSHHHIKVNTQQLRDLSVQLANISRSLDQVANTVGTHSRSIQHFNFIGTAAIRASLLASKLQITNLSSNAENLSDTIGEIAMLYDRAEDQILSQTHA